MPPVNRRLFFSRTVIDLLVNIERQDEKESGRVKIELKRRLMIEFGLKNSIIDNFKAVVIIS